MVISKDRKRIYDKEYAKRHHDVIKKRNAENYKKNAAAYLEKRRIQRLEHPEEVRAKVRKYRANSEKYKEHDKAYRDAHKEEIHANGARYRKENAAKIKENRVKYQEEHREETREKYMLTRKQLIDSHGGHCVICGYNKNQAVLEFHHVNPNEKDSSHRLTVEEANKCVLLCNRCHREHHNGWIQYN